MSKLFKLKKWLTLPDAAKYLTCTLEEEVTEAHILRFALDQQLKLSIQLVNGAYARRLNAINSTTELKYKEIIGLDGELLMKRTIGGPIRSIGMGVFQLTEYVTPLEAGIWDLPLFDYVEDNGASLDIEHKYQMLTGGAAVTTVNIDGKVIIANTKGGLYELQADLDDNEFATGSTAQFKKLKQHIVDNHLEGADAEKLLNQHKEDRTNFLAKRMALHSTENYHPAGCLPDDSILVVRTDALMEFVNNISDEPQALAPQPESTRKTENLLRALASIAIDAYGYTPESAKSTIPQDIADAISKHGLTFDPKTIRGWLKEGIALLPTKPQKI